MSTYRIHLPNLRPDLAPHLEKSIESVPGVSAVTCETEPACVLVEHEGADQEKVLAALREEGFEGRLE